MATPHRPAVWTAPSPMIPPSRQIYLFGGTKHSGERTNDAVPNPLPKMSVGLMQINVRVPRGAETGQRPVVLKMGDRQSQILVYM